MRRERGIALESTALARLRREQVIRPDNPSDVGAAALPSLLGKRFAFAPRDVCGCRSIPRYPYYLN